MIRELAAGVDLVPLLRVDRHDRRGEWRSMPVGATAWHDAHRQTSRAPEVC